MLSEDFVISKYGINARLVQEKDAAFIISLRTDSDLSQHIHITSSSIDDQINWIKEYKKRENEGRDYYFIYEKDGKAIGVNRLSEINVNTGVTGSAICPKTNSPIDTLATIVLLYDIVFEILNLDYVTFATDNDNSHALRINYALGAEVVSDNGKEKLFHFDKEQYLSVRSKLIRIWRLMA